MFIYVYVSMGVSFDDRRNERVSLPFLPLATTEREMLSIDWLPFLSLPLSREKEQGESDTASIRGVVVNMSITLVQT